MGSAHALLHVCLAWVQIHTTAVVFRTVALQLSSPCCRSLCSPGRNNLAVALQFGPSDKMQQHGFARNVDCEFSLGKIARLESVSNSNRGVQPVCSRLPDVGMHRGYCAPIRLSQDGCGAAFAAAGEIASTSADPQPDDRDPEVTLVLTDSEYSRKM